MSKKKIAIIYCKKIKDYSCIGCVKCYKGAAEHNGEFARFADDELEISFMTDCGDCPGILMPRVMLMMDTAEHYGRRPDAIYFGSCMKKASMAGCPIDFDKFIPAIKEKFGVEVILGTHDIE
jgi:predicted metal-binding protein